MTAKELYDIYRAGCKDDSRPVWRFLTLKQQHAWECVARRVNDRIELECNAVKLAAMLGDLTNTPAKVPNVINVAKLALDAMDSEQSARPMPRYIMGIAALERFAKAYMKATK